MEMMAAKSTYCLSLASDEDNDSNKSISPAIAWPLCSLSKTT